MALDGMDAYWKRLSTVSAGSAFVLKRTGDEIEVTGPLEQVATLLNLSGDPPHEYGRRYYHAASGEPLDVTNPRWASRMSLVSLPSPEEIVALFADTTPAPQKPQAESGIMGPSGDVRMFSGTFNLITAARSIDPELAKRVDERFGGHHNVSDHYALHRLYSDREASVATIEKVGRYLRGERSKELELVAEELPWLYFIDRFLDVYRHGGYEQQTQIVRALEQSKPYLKPEPDDPGRQFFGSPLDRQGEAATLVARVVLAPARPGVVSTLEECLRLAKEGKPLAKVRKVLELELPRP